ncbi:MAG: cysteine desulfurase family protein [Chthonomonadales bacterium]
MIYLDNITTTRTDPRVLEAMLPYFTEFYASAGSTHFAGSKAKTAVEDARGTIASLIGAAHPREIVFTSGATEADNLAVKGVAEACAEIGDHVVTLVTEHPAVLEPCRRLEREGFRVTYLGVDWHGLASVEDLENALTPDTILVSVMSANHEIGVLQDVASLAAVCRERGIVFHTDAAQAVGKIPFNVRTLGVDLASLTSHKIYGPKGIGALYVREGLAPHRIRPQLDGVGEEQGLRAGTLNVPAIVGFAKALQLCAEEMAEAGERLTALRERFLCILRQQVDGVQVNGHPTRRLPGDLSISIEGVRARTLLEALPDIALSAGSAWQEDTMEPSPVLLALGIPPERALSTIHISIGRFNTAAEVDRAAQRIVGEVRRMRSR